MKQIEAEQAKVLGLKKEGDGWVPKDGHEIHVRLRGEGARITALANVSRIVANETDWFIWSDAGREVSWVKAKHILLVGSVGGVDGEDGSRAGFV